MKKLISIYNKAEEYFLCYGMILMVIIVFIQVFCRYVLNNSLSWSEELVRYIFVWQVWLGASLGMRINEHIRVDMFVKKLPEAAKKVLDLLIIILLLWFYGALVVYGFQYLQSAIDRNMTSTALQIPLAWVYGSLPIGSFIIAIRYLALFFKKTKALFDRPDGKEGEMS